MAKFNLDTSMKELMANPAAVEVLKEILPKLVTNPMVVNLPMNLRQIASFTGGKISEDKLKEVEEKLAKVE